MPTRIVGGLFGNSTPKPVLEIRPDFPFFFVQGPRGEAPEVEISGKLVLTSPEPIVVKGIQIKLEGKRSVTFFHPPRQPRMRQIKYTFHTDKQTLFPTEGSKKPHKVGAGVHTWSFKFKLPGNFEESVEGLRWHHVIYSMTASISRDYYRSLEATKHIRLIRTLSREEMEAGSLEQLHADVWKNKLAYKISIPQVNYIVGTSITADFVLTPLRKGVEIKDIQMYLEENVNKQVPWGDPPDIENWNENDSPKIVATTTTRMPENCARMVPEGLEDTDQLFDESYQFQLKLELPRTLLECRQSVDAEHLNISHKLRILVNIMNPEGHTSQLAIKNAVRLFISPNLPPNEDQTVTVDSNRLAVQALHDEELQAAPPMYELHQLDELYSDIDPSGFMTPGGRGTSGTNTPFYGHSRSQSFEHLPGLSQIVGQHGDAASAAALRYRLQNLTVSDHSTLGPGPPSRQHSSGASTPGGYFAGALAPQPVEYNMEALSRTPSYNTAVRTPVRTPINEGLPTYASATSQPSSAANSPPSTHRELSTPSPSQSLDPVDEETERNTALNSGRTPPIRPSRPSHEQR